MTSLFAVNNNSISEMLNIARQRSFLSEEDYNWLKIKINEDHSPQIHDVYIPERVYKQYGTSQEEVYGLVINWYNPIRFVKTTKVNKGRNNIFVTPQTRQVSINIARYLVSYLENDAITDKKEYAELLENFREAYDLTDSELQPNTCQLKTGND